MDVWPLIQALLLERGRGADEFLPVSAPDQLSPT
jgi:hypothetical protein